MLLKKELHVRVKAIVLKNLNKSYLTTCMSNMHHCYNWLITKCGLIFNEN